MLGGLSPELKTWSPLTDSAMKRPFDPPKTSLATDLLWSDPHPMARGWEANDRRIGYIFSAQIVKDFCTQMDIDLIVRGHQVVQDGYEFFANKRLVTVFTAPKYCGEFDNIAGVMEVDEVCSFQQLKPKTKLPKMKAPLKQWKRSRSKEYSAKSTK